MVLVLLIILILEIVLIIVRVLYFYNKRTKIQDELLEIKVESNELNLALTNEQKRVMVERDQIERARDTIMDLKTELKLKEELLLELKNKMNQ